MLEQERATTVGNAYRSSLRSLSNTMMATAQHYVRCIKPNEQQKKEVFSGRVTERQMRYTGVGSVVEIQRSGYPVSFPHLDFLGLSPDPNLAFSPCRRRRRCCCCLRASSSREHAFLACQAATA